jgi:single-strand DNA-binding protein
VYSKTILAGHLTRDIELKYIPSGAAIAKSAIATSHKYKTATGEQKDEVCFIDFTVFGKSAEIINQYVRKGSKVLLEGRLIFEQWTDQNGQNRSKHSLRVETFKFLDNKGDSVSQNNNSSYSAPQQNSNQNYNQNNNNQNYSQPPMQHKEEKIPEINIDDEEIPF